VKQKALVKNERMEGKRNGRIDEGRKRKGTDTEKTKGWMEGRTEGQKERGNEWKGYKKGKEKGW
jgi:hypothetical protein